MTKPLRVPYYRPTYFTVYQNNQVDRSDQDTYGLVNPTESNTFNGDYNSFNALEPHQEESNDASASSERELSNFHDFDYAQSNDDLPHVRQGSFFKNDPSNIYSTPISEHVEVTKPVGVPSYKDIGNSYFKVIC